MTASYWFPTLTAWLGVKHCVGLIDEDLLILVALQPFKTTIEKRRGGQQLADSVAKLPKCRAANFPQID